MKKISTTVAIIVTTLILTIVLGCKPTNTNPVPNKDGIYEVSLQAGPLTDSATGKRATVKAVPIQLPYINLSWWSDPESSWIRVYSCNVLHQWRIEYWVNGKYKGETNPQEDTPADEDEDSEVRMHPNLDANALFEVTKAGEYGVEARLFIDDVHYYPFAYTVSLYGLDFNPWVCSPAEDDRVKVTFYLRPSFGNTIIDGRTLLVSVKDYSMEMVQENDGYGNYYAETFVEPADYETFFEYNRMVRACANSGTPKEVCTSKDQWFTELEYLYPCE